jgi:protein-L-isoaspartate(D-aspartate) O-methyltransferase
MHDIDFARQRERLVDVELRDLGIRDEAVLAAMRSVPREEFVDGEQRPHAYRNATLPIGGGQTISQPLIVALMIEAARVSADDRVLEIGTGSGYAAAVLARIVKDVFTVERLPELAESAAERLHRLGYSNVHVLVGDGTRGWSEKAPFDAIIVSAAAPQVPPALLQQLCLGGRLVIPVGEDRESQELVRVVRRGVDEFDREDLGGVRFVPLIGDAGWQPSD